VARNPADPIFDEEEAQIRDAAARFEHASAEEILSWALEQFHPRMAISAAGGGDGVVIVDLAWRINPDVRVFTLDTGRLPPETYTLFEEVRDRYGINVEFEFPDRAQVEELVNLKGPNLMYKSLENRLACCDIRKVLPLKRKLATLDAWVAGLRRFAGESEPLIHGVLDPNAKVNPPLRPEDDALGLRDVLLRGVFDFVATDHAPHAADEKARGVGQAPFGMTGLEVAIPQMARLLEQGVLDWPAVVALFTCRPADALHLNGGSLAIGADADITVIDPRKSWVIDANTLRTKSKNTPLLGLELRGRAVMTIVGGEVRHDELS